MAKRMDPQPWPPIPQFRGGGFAATPRPTAGVVTWNINTACNYRCSYCTQRFLPDRTRRGQEAAIFLRHFQQLPGQWEFKLSGGEPFLHPELLQIATGLSQQNHLVSIVTNLSASLDQIESFVLAAGSALRVFSASLHLDYMATPSARDTFREKALWIQTHLPPQAHLNVTCVATPHYLPQLPALAQWFGDSGILFKIQPEKQQRQVIEYTPEEQRLLQELGGHNQLGAIEFKFQGRPCWAGALSFTLDDQGDAWRCYPARRFRSQYLGNLLEGSFQLAQGPSPCLYSYCNCTVPIERHMMPQS